MIPSYTKDGKKRTKQEMILMVLSAATVVALIPFIILRAQAAQWGSLFLDVFLLAVFTVNGIYIYKTSKVKIPRLVFASVIVFAMFLGFYLKGTGQIPWSYPALVAIFFAVRPKLAIAFCLICILWLSAILFPLMDTFSFVTFLVTICFTCLFVYVFANLTRQQRIALIKLTRLDPLTQLRNRRAFDQKMEEVVGLVRKGQQTSLILFDIDHFKRINDSLGHSHGDKVLNELGRVVSNNLRKRDRLYRIGGEEFAIVLANSELEKAMIVAENIRIKVEMASLTPKCKVTISLGIAEYIENESSEQWFERCDNALYLAKDSGRNLCKSAPLQIKQSA